MSSKSLGDRIVDAAMPWFVIVLMLMLSVVAVGYLGLLIHVFFGN